MRKATALILALLISLSMVACAPIADSPLSTETEDEGIPAAELVPSFEQQEDEALDGAQSGKYAKESGEPSKEEAPANSAETTDEPYFEGELTEEFLPEKGTKKDMYYEASAQKPLSGLIIGLDPGHQTKANTDREPVAPNSKNMKYKVTGGTQGRFTGVPEYEVNLNVALMLRDLLEEQGAKVVMTRETNDVDISNKERAEFFNEQQTDYALRLHCNGSDDKSIHGAFMLVPTANPYLDECKEAARLLIDSYCAKTGAKNLGLTYRSDQTGFNWSTRMVINIEMGHMTNEDEDKKLTDGEYQKLMAQGLFEGIMKYFEK